MHAHGVTGTAVEGTFVLVCVDNAVGGEDLYTELSYQDVCRAGEARICRSFNLPSTHIAYTVRTQLRVPET